LKIDFDRELILVKSELKRIDLCLDTPTQM